MPYVSPVVENDFKDRLNKCVDIIKNSSIKYQSFGIFGSHVRKLYEALEIMIYVVEVVNDWRKSHELEILIVDPREEFQSAMCN